MRLLVKVAQKVVQSRRQPARLLSLRQRCPTAIDVFFSSRRSLRVGGQTYGKVILNTVVPCKVMGAAERGNNNQFRWMCGSNG